MKYLCAVLAFVIVACYIEFLFWMYGTEIFVRSQGAGAAFFIASIVSAYAAFTVIMFWKEKQ